MEMIIKIYQDSVEKLQLSNGHLCRIPPNPHPLTSGDELMGSKEIGRFHEKQLLHSNHYIALPISTVTCWGVIFLVED